MRLTIKDISEASGFCRDTVRKYADTGAIPFQKDVNGWRIFDERSVEIAKKLAGTRQDSTTGDKDVAEKFSR